MKTKQIVVVMPSGSEYYAATDTQNVSFLNQVCKDAIRKFGLTTPRKNPIPIKVEVFELDIKNGQMIRRKINTFSVTPTLERMTEVEYNEEMKDILFHIPEEFHDYVVSTSWDEGHSSGYEECVNIARSMVDNLKPCITKYGDRVYHSARSRYEDSF